MAVNSILLSLIISIVFNLFVFFIAYKKQTDKLTDITYSLTFIIVTLALLFLNKNELHNYHFILVTMIVIWALRLGSYLFRRILIKGKDDRFDGFRHRFTGFGKFFILQAVSIWIVSLPFVLALNTSQAEASIAYDNICMPIGVTIFIVGWIIETIADAQKFKFRSNPKNEGRFMSLGLFKIVRFPNYTGEILLWIGVFIYCAPILGGIKWLAIISPIWIITLLLFISGIPFLEKSNQERYGHLESFMWYKSNTKKLIPGIY